ncbi:ABC transporter permease [Paenibacillus psychroresistens]|uniref:ABC transporter permease n=1 Tax=Paenibacillus psychroresistens TaxID=1778678 RepID=A0A6B8RCI6_9BACL|nr:oligopeptide ABC transporter permease [Paenibacillus psychroresistens]QGQ94009.1 ABC transporter permease [Paenibacillus psychroresistens]
MLTYAFRRLLGMIPLMILVSVVVFSLAKLMPGDALMGKIDPKNSSPQYIAEMREKLGYNQPILTQYWSWIKHVLQGDLGQSFVHKKPVGAIIAERIPNTLLLMLLSLCITYSLSIAMGMYAGRRPNRLGDHFILSLNYVAYSIPTFVAAIAAIYVFSFKLGWVPASGSIGIGLDEGSFSYYISKLKYAILPSLVLGLFSTAAYTQFLRNEIMENSRKDYVRTAMAKGTKLSRIYSVHIFQNSLIPLITFLGFDIGALLSGTVVVETIFTYPGIGQLVIQSVNSRDYSVLMSVMMLLSFMTLIGNLIADLLYGLVDPRIRLD